jgi:hypothetical protein
MIDDLLIDVAIGALDHRVIIDASRHLSNHR